MGQMHQCMESPKWNPFFPLHKIDGGENIITAQTHANNVRYTTTYML
jgi:hypothetical protein